jgi:hypothetical protein
VKADVTWALDEADALVAEGRGQALAEASYLVADIEGVKALARRLLRVHPLRSADKLQLAPAVVWAGGWPQGKTPAHAGRTAGAGRAPRMIRRAVETAGRAPTPNSTWPTFRLGAYAQDLKERLSNCRKRDRLVSPSR